MKEIWKIIPEYPEYTVSNLGRIKSKPRQGTKHEILRGYASKYGYIRINLHTSNGRYTRFLHVLVASQFCKKESYHVQVNHIDGDKKNNAASNLEWCTISENSLHAYRLGLRKAHPTKGEKHYASKLKNHQVLEIRAYEGEKTQKELSIIYGVSKGVIQRIIERRSWKHL